MAGAEYEVLWPLSRKTLKDTVMSRRFADGSAKRIGFVWDYMFRGEEIFPILEAELTARFEGLEVVGYDTFGNIHGGDEASRVQQLPHVLATYRVDAVVCGNGC